MEPRSLLDLMHTAEKLKDATRHCYTSQGRRESVAEHSWRMALMAYCMWDEFPGADMEKVIRMCLIHDLGEAFTGDIPTFEKKAADEKTEEKLLMDWVDSLPENISSSMRTLFLEMAERKTPEAKIYKAIDGLEALIQHNESDIKTWIPKELELNKTYADDKVAFSPYLTCLRQAIREDTLQKISESKKEW